MNFSVRAEPLTESEINNRYYKESDYLFWKFIQIMISLFLIISFGLLAAAFLWFPSVVIGCLAMVAISAIYCVYSLLTYSETSKSMTEWRLHMPQDSVMDSVKQDVLEAISTQLPEVKIYLQKVKMLRRHLCEGEYNAITKEYSKLRKS